VGVIAETWQSNGRAHRTQTTFKTQPVTYDVPVQRGC